MQYVLKCGIYNSIDGTEDDGLLGEFVGGRQDLEPEEVADDDEWHILIYVLQVNSEGNGL